jgi:hypothetical protein
MLALQPLRRNSCQLLGMKFLVITVGEILKAWHLESMCGERHHSLATASGSKVETGLFMEVK